MSEVVQETHQEFWRPPSPVMAEELVFPEVAPTMAVTCKRCGTEFLLGSRFCHTCGARRPEAMSTASTRMDAAALAGFWRQGISQLSSGSVAIARFTLDHLKTPVWLRSLSFEEITDRIGLRAASLIAFVIGLGCVAGALLVGLLNARTLVDWQAIQFYRVEWLLGATASFVAGILLKKTGNSDRN